MSKKQKLPSAKKIAREHHLAAEELEKFQRFVGYNLQSLAAIVAIRSPGVDDNQAKKIKAARRKADRICKQIMGAASGNLLDALIDYQERIIQMLGDANSKT